VVNKKRRMRRKPEPPPAPLPHPQRTRGSAEVRAAPQGAEERMNPMQAIADMAARWNRLTIDRIVSAKDAANHGGNE